MMYDYSTDASPKKQHATKRQLEKLLKNRLRDQTKQTTEIQEINGIDEHLKKKLMEAGEKIGRTEENNKYKLNVRTKALMEFIKKLSSEGKRGTIEYVEQ
ncbi:hypothetical protein HHI36_015086 [Cryptolaemus montrouzieri]|uniref:Uncharacterized protein n=1 Tax=Cryptolaemus montrouzieri TaxID=559131 RepID=A0ABD2N5R1_9CUCU